MTSDQAVKPLNGSHAQRMYDRWIKDSRVKSIAIKPVKETVARVLSDLSIRTDTLAVGRPGMMAKCEIEERLLSQAGISEGFFFILMQRNLRRIRGERSPDTALSHADSEGYLTFTYKA